jgi:hypothetical protein
MSATTLTVATIDDLFTGPVVLGVPAAETEYQRKMPGQSDAQGDHC